MEIYVYSEGNKAIQVVHGRNEAVKRLLKDNFHTTASEKKAVSNFLEGNVCEVGQGVHLVGYPPEIPDRKITRVLGPGSNE